MSADQKKFLMIAGIAFAVVIVANYVIKPQLDRTVAKVRVKLSTPRATSAVPLSVIR